MIAMRTTTIPVMRRPSSPTSRWNGVGPSSADCIASAMPPISERIPVAVTTNRPRPLATEVPM